MVTEMVTKSDKPPTKSGQVRNREPEPIQDQRRVVQFRSR